MTTPARVQVTMTFDYEQPIGEEWKDLQTLVTWLQTAGHPVEIATQGSDGGNPIAGSPAGTPTTVTPGPRRGRPPKAAAAAAAAGANGQAPAQPAAELNDGTGPGEPEDDDPLGIMPAPSGLSPAEAKQKALDTAFKIYNHGGKGKGHPLLKPIQTKFAVALLRDVPDAKAHDLLADVTQVAEANGISLG